MSKAEFQTIFNGYIKRPGSDKLTQWLEITDFYTAPASTKFHDDYAGGLCDHSVNVWNHLCKLLKTYPEIKPSFETAAIISLLHDVCKIGFYKADTRNVKENGVWVSKPYYAVEESFPFGGHGSKSAYLIGKFITLTDEEAVCIVNHMGNEDGKYTAYNSYREYPLAWLLHVADEAATVLYEKRGEK